MENEITSKNIDKKAIQNIANKPGLEIQKFRNKIDNNNARCCLLA